MFPNSPLSNEERENLAMEAMSLIEEAEQIEESNPAKAAFTYQQAADKLARSRLVPQEKIDSIYTHVTHLNQVAQYRKQQAQQAQPEGPSPEALQNAGFEALDKAKDAEKNGQIGYALELYYYAINVLAQGGWDEGQLKGLKDEVQRLQLKARAPPPAPVAGVPAMPTPRDEPYTPTFMTVPGGQAPPKAPPMPGAPGGRPEGHYTPTFATLPGANAPPPAPNMGASTRQEPEAPYVPTFTSLPANQSPDSAQAPSSRIVLSTSDEPASLDDIMSMLKGIQDGPKPSEEPPERKPAEMKTLAPSTPNPSETIIKPEAKSSEPKPQAQTEEKIAPKIPAAKPTESLPTPEKPPSPAHSSKQDNSIEDTNLKRLDSLLDNILKKK